MKIITVNIHEKNGNIFSKIFNMEDFKIYLLNINEYDYRFIEFTYILGEDEAVIDAKIYKKDNSYCIETTKDYKYWFLKVNERYLFDLLASENIIHVIKNPKKFNFIQKVGYKVTCSSNINFNNKVNNDIDSIIKCLDRLTDGIIYIYNYDTNSRFMIEKFSDKYCVSILNYYRDFEKNKLITFLKKHDIKIFNQIEKYPEKYNFLWEE